jgi:NAD(P)H dehydrogenase (quinone)
MDKVSKFIRTSARTLTEIGEVLGIRNLDPESGLIFITGGTGVVGHRVALKLLNAGYPQVRLGVMNTDTVEDKNKLGAEIADFSWNREDTYAKALKDVKSVLVTIPYCQDWEKHFPAFFDACIKAGVKHFVKISYYHARVPGDPFKDVPLVKAHGDCDQHVVTSLTPGLLNVMAGDVDVGLDLTPRMSYTILYASHFMSNPFTFYSNELHSKLSPVTFYGASKGHGVNYVSPNDVAEVAVRVLLEPRPHYLKEYTLTGPEAIKDQEVADLIGKHLDKPVMYVDQPIHEFQTELRVGGDADWLVKDLVALETIKATGNEENENFKTNDFETICGHKPQTFEEYLNTKDLMTPVEAGAEDALKPLKETIA